MSLLSMNDKDAIAKISMANVEDYIKKGVRDLVVNGVAILKSAHEDSTCSSVIEAYERWQSQNQEYVNSNLDEFGREKRLVDFHHTSAAALRVGLSDHVMKFLDCIFECEVGLYSSLTFKYGTQQPIHRDAPHFATWPKLSFCGVWTALEDVTSTQGPLMYYKRAHKIGLNEKDALTEAQKRYPLLSQENIARKALDIYNGHVIDMCNKLGDPDLLLLETGDTVIWHPNLPHGGMVHEDFSLTRWSIVFHCAPAHLQVYQHQDFFYNADSSTPPPTRYGFRTASNGRKIAIAGETAYM